MQNMKYLKRVLMFSDCTGCEVCRCIADLVAEPLISRLCGSSAFVLASIQPVAFLQHPLAIMSMFQSTHLRLYKWKHVGTARDSEWLLLDQSGQVFFVRRTKTQRLAIGAQGSWAMQNGRLHLKEFACTPGATLRDHDFSVVKAEHYVDGNRRLLHVAEIDRLGGTIAWSPTVRGFTRDQWLFVVRQVREEVLGFIGCDHITIDTQEPSEWQLLF